MKQDLPIPEAALRDHMAVLAKTGAGKTSKAKLIVEHIATPGWQNLPEGARVCILDPIKSDYWGLTSSRDGKKPGLPFQILGGPHGHVPLNSQSGKVIGELVASGALRLSILDMADFEPGGLQRFFSAFADTLFRKNKGILYLVVEEAHEFAPKERSGMGNENLSIHHFKKLATGTRTKGIRLIVCTQRTQALHNAVLGSCETVVAGRFTAPADQAPVLDWFKANVSKEKFAEIKASMSNLKNPESWVACGEADFLERVQFPRIATFDNTATPEHGAEAVEVRTAPVDRAALAQMIGLAAAEADANDPKALKDKVQELTARLAAGGGAATQADAEALAAEYAKGETDGYADAMMTVAIHLDPIMDALGDARSGLVKGQDLIATLHGVASKGKNQPENITDNIQAAPPHPTMTPSVKLPVADRFYREPPAPPEHAVAKGMTKAKQKVIDAVNWFHTIGIDPVARDRACVVAGLSPTASTFGVYTAELGRDGLMVAANGTLSLTAAGRAKANKPKLQSRYDLHGAALGLLKGAKQVEAFNRVYAHFPKSMNRDALADAMKLSRTASTLGVYLAALVRLGIIENAEPGHVRAAEWLFPAGLK